VKEFWVYTLLRLTLFVVSFAIVYGVWWFIAGELDRARDNAALWAVIIAFVFSGVGSYFLLGRQREALAQKVEGRAAKMTEKLEESRSKEDVD
jgi:type VI protein secretion system component VasK